MGHIFTTLTRVVLCDVILSKRRGIYLHLAVRKSEKVTRGRQEGTRVHQDRERWPVLSSGQVLCTEFHCQEFM